MSLDDHQRLSQIDTMWTQMRAAHGGGDAARTAQAAILHRYSGAMFRYLVAAVKDADQAQDLLQDFAVKFMEGRLQGATPDKGRFRHYLKRALHNLVINHFRSQRAEPETAEAIDHVAEHEPADDEFAEHWRMELISRTWDGLRQWETETGQPFHSVLRCRVENPDADGAALAAEYERRTGKRITDAWWRTRLHQARAKFAECMVQEVTRALVEPTREEIVQELIELGLYERCKQVL